MKIVLSVIIISTIIIVLAGYSSFGSQKFSYISVTVQPGDTLWNIAKRYNHDNNDIRKLVSQIRQTNDLESVLLNPGQVIRIPENP